MMTIDQIKGFYPPVLSEKAAFTKYLFREYVQLLILDYLSTTPHVRKLTFIGGTNLRLVKGIDRFSEDLDFDCKDLDEDEFRGMSDDVVTFLQRSGFQVVPRETESNKLTAFRRSLRFPELLFDLGLSGHREERFMVKLEAQDQGVPYEPTLAFIKGCGFFFSFPVPSDETLCAMKVSTALTRGKGRDYYDAMFLLSQTGPDYRFLAERCGIHDLAELKTAASVTLQTVNLHHKQKDFEHLLFNRDNSRRILNFPQFIHTL